jgi:SAM-dependent methyltransferase
VDAAFKRWLGELRWSEIARALSALSQDYVQRRHRVQAGEALEGRGKRAAFALYYAPRHYVLTREVLSALDAASAPSLPIVDLGCGLGVAGAAWAALHDPPPSVTGVDTNEWTLGEARLAYRALGITGRALRSSIERFRFPTAPYHTVAAFTVNELDAAARDALLAQVRQSAKGGGATLVLEPLATRIAPWWKDWAAAFTTLGGRADEWRFDAPLPGRVAELGRSAHLDPRELGCRSLWLTGA